MCERQPYSKYKKLGLKISYYRKLRGLTQEQLAEKPDINAAYLDHGEPPNINKVISLDTLLDISEVLNVPPSKFLDFDDD